MTYVFSILSFLIGLGVSLLGLLFLVGYGGQLHRLVIAALGLAIGALLMGAGAWGLKYALARSPVRMRKEVLAFAGKRNGRITEAELVAAMPGRAELAVRALQELKRAGYCGERFEKGVTYFEFQALQSTLMVRRCSHCGWEAPLSSQVSTCQQCGGPVVMGRASDDDAIGLDG